MKIKTVMTLMSMVGAQCVRADDAVQQSEWTRCYQKKFSNTDSQQVRTHTAVTFEKDNTILFNQLLFSWNVFRPEQGFFSFFVQARNAHTKQWGSWHMIADWGHGIQKSYADTSSPGHTENKHVRLEHKKGMFSDAFRIKVTAHDGADLKDVKMLSACVANMDNFKPEHARDYAQLPTAYVSKVPAYSQMLIDHPDMTSMCSPTSTAMLVSFMTKKLVDVRSFAQGVYDSGLAIYGSWPFNTAYAYDYCKGSVWFSVMRLDSFKMLYARLLHHIPVIVSIVGPIAGGARPYAGGHLLLVVGYDAKTQELLCHDPAFESLPQVAHRYPLADFLKAWEKRHRLAYIAQPVE